MGKPGSSLEREHFFQGVKAVATRLLMCYLTALHLLCYLCGFFGKHRESFKFHFWTKEPLWFCPETQHKPLHLCTADTSLLVTSTNKSHVKEVIFLHMCPEHFSQCPILLSKLRLTCLPYFRKQTAINRLHS